MPFEPGRRMSFLMRSGPAHEFERKHLFIILTNQQPYEISQDGHVLCVSVCSILTGHPFDASCELSEKDHAFIRHPSYVSYREARVYKASNLIARQHEIILKEDLDVPVFVRVCQGLLVSPQVAAKYRRFYEKAMLAE